MSAWIDLQRLRPGATTQSVLREFATRFTGALRDWFDSLGQYRQLQFVDLPEVSSALAVLHDQFLSDPSAVFEAAKRDYLNMKCCSLNAKDLDFHYKRMSLLFYKLNGFNEPTLKHVFLASLPDELQPDIQRQLTASNLSLDNISLGKIFQLAKTYPESPTGSPERNLPPPENSNESTQADVSSAREKATMPKIAPTKEKNPSVPIPSIKLQILPSKFQRPIPAIGLIDTGAQRSMLNPHILPSEYWTQFEEHFKAVNGKLFTTSLITKKPIGSHDEHHQLLTQFYDILQSHGIMLSAKKSTIATNNIEFIGMVIKDGHYQPGKHIAQELLHFPGQQLSKRQIQQFLGIINYIRDFIPHVDHYTHHLSALLKKKPPEWNADHTIAVTTLKQITQNPPPLKMITDGQRILQTDASLTLDPTRDTTEDVLWYIWCLTVLYATKLVLPISPTLDHLLNPENATSLTWTLLEWFSPIPWWRKKLQQLSKIYNLDRMPAPEAQMFTSVFIIHRPYFQHPDTNLFWTQDQVYEWFTAPHIAVIENDIQDVLHNYLCQLNHQPPPLKDISHTSLGPQHDILMIPTPSAISKPKSTGIIIKEERPDYTDFLYQDSQDPWEDFLPLSQHLHQFPQPTMDEPGPSEPGSSSQPSKADKATQTPSPKSQPSPSKPGYRRDCPYPPCQGPNCKHPKLSKTFFPKSNHDNPYETESSFEDDYMNLCSP
ncbi:hypothetical protein KPL71_023760 [Citrus sinensis]|uniref:Uncharacterized protein n=1 Tax=Citrus sinensis TaxID=2711 RepID=A0ACB8IKY9_CITSI|nr:hypothetical protein KPL71_023760 [Citrus sinensis]